MLHPNLFLLVLLLFMTAQFAACSFIDTSEGENRSAREIYTTAKKALLNKGYSVAIENYEKLEQNYPFSEYSRNALLEHAYANFEYQEYDKAIALTDRFIKNYPGDPSLDYAYYLRGLSYFDVGSSLLDYVVPRDRTRKNIEPLIESLETFSKLYASFPNSKYQEEAQIKIVELRNMLAVHELRVASYYFRRESYIAAIKRMKYLLEHYEGVQHTPDALYMLAISYQRIKRSDLANDTLRVLKKNYPDYPLDNLQHDIQDAGNRPGFLNHLQMMLAKLLG